MSHLTIGRTWGLLVLLTGLTFALGESGSLGQSAVSPVLLVLGCSGLKALLVILEYLEMRQAPALWRWLLLGWLILVLSLIVLAYWMAR
ncbi:MAG: cytochrome C oxidase subunit IV family protein [Burkholderiaceae bacterium]|nr:cytochrome C oxidase subunit IV family protein [Burkholderiaceae bacterium]